MLYRCEGSSREQHHPGKSTESNTRRVSHTIIPSLLHEVIRMCVLYDSVISSKKTLHYQAEEGARLDTENKELQFGLAQLKENHVYVHTLHC